MSRDLLHLLWVWSRERLRGAEGDDDMELAGKKILHRKKHEPEICASVCFFVSWRSTVLLPQGSFPISAIASGMYVRKPSISLQASEWAIWLIDCGRGYMGPSLASSGRREAKGLVEG